MIVQTSLAWHSLRSRRSAFLATFVSIMLAAALIGSFATLIETAQADSISMIDSEMLMVMGVVVGSWGAIIALFSLTSTIGIAVRQRDTEIGLLRIIGSTPRQARRLIRLETLVVAITGTALGAVLAWAGGAALLALLRSNDIVASTIKHQAGLLSLGATAVALVLVALVAATLAGGKATRGPAHVVVADGQTGTARMPWWRIVLGTVLVGSGVSMAVLTVTIMTDSSDPFAPMMTAGSACIVVASGLAALAPILLRWFAAVVRPALGRAGPSGYLAGFNTSRRANVLGGILGSVTMFVATTVGVLMMVGIDGRTLEAIAPDLQEAQTITLLNNVVTGMIALFAAIMMVNSLVAVIGQRSAEFGLLQLVGATREQIRHSVVTEAWLVAAAGMVLGLLASMATVIPYSVARGEGIVPDGQLWLPPLLVVIAVGITLVGAVVAVNRTLDRVREAGPRASASI
ncbi:MAG: FtsX-like permease family protein [Acidimicrobiia bacterium]|nr:FtsX-like permease family protein [Acidimicrobiia bacterium]